MDNLDNILSNEDFIKYIKEKTRENKIKHNKLLTEVITSEYILDYKNGGFEADLYINFIERAYQIYEGREIQEADHILRSFIKHASLYLDSLYIRTLEKKKKEKKENEDGL